MNSIKVARRRYLPRFATPQRCVAAMAIALAAMATLIPGSALAAARATAPSPATEHLQLASTSARSTKLTAIATGLFTAGGIASGDFTQGGTEVVKVQGGTFKVTAGRFLGSSGISLRTCLSSTGGKGTFKIHGGTGKYAGLRGSGTFAIRILSVSVRLKSGGCGRTVVSQSMITLNGPVRM